MKLVAGNSNRPLAEAIATYLSQDRNELLERGSVVPPAPSD